MVRVGSTLLALGLAALGACGTDAVGVDTCRKVESARCTQASRCGIPLDNPPHRNSPTTDVEACIRYYDTACLHGLATNVDPGAPAVQACVDAINTSTDCDVVVNPQNHPACAWLIPPAPEAGTPTTDADATDAPADGPASTSDGGAG